VFLALENHTADRKSRRHLKLVRDVKSPVRRQLGHGNFHTADPYADLAQLAPYAINVQSSDIPTPLARSARATSASWRQLLAPGYRGYIVLEFEESEDPRVACHAVRPNASR